MWFIINNVKQINYIHNIEMFVKKNLESLKFYTIFNIYYLIMHIFLIIYINFISALKEYQHDYDLNMIIMAMKIK